MRKSATSFPPVTSEIKPVTGADAAIWTRWLVPVLGSLVIVYLVWLAVVEVLRVQFPWDLFMWPESPFMTNMLKLELGQPLFGPPADGNSFVYSPGLEYLTFAILKPLGLHLDIRFCRLVNIGVGILAAIVAGLAIRRAVRFVSPENRFASFVGLGGAVALLVIFKNFTADLTHPDNLVMLHTTGVFFLTLWAWREKSFSIAVAAMLFAGLGVLAKQILTVAFLGPALVFARFNPWGWRRWLTLTLIGGISAASILIVITWTPESRFYLLKLLPRQGIHVTRFYWMVIDLVTADRAFLLMLGLIATGLLWNSGKAGREYVQFCAAIGIFSVCPNMASYVKTMGIWNNLIIFQLWLLLLVWPAMTLWLSRASLGETAHRPETRLLNWTVLVLLVTFVFLLFPPKMPPPRQMYTACAEIQKRIDADIKAGRRVLVGHGLMYLLRAGSREVPLDRANSLLELRMGGFADFSRFDERIRQHYYDRMYLAVEPWYPTTSIDEIHKYYEIEAVVPRIELADHPETGRFLPLIAECKILKPRSPGPGGDTLETKAAK